MIRLTRAESLGDAVFLTDSDESDRLHRVPAAPSPVVVAGAPELRLLLFREAMGDGAPELSSGAILSALIDTAPASRDLDRAEVALRSQRGHNTPAASTIAMSGGELTLHFGGRKLVSAPVAAGARSLVALSAQLSVEAATLVSASVGGATSPLAITARYEFSALYEGPPMRVTVRGDDAARWLGDASIMGADIDAKIDEAMANGVVRLELTGDGDPRSVTARCLIAGALFAPVASGTWSGVPALHGVGSVRARGGSTATWTLTPGGEVRVPIFASAELPAVPAANRAAVEIAASQVQRIELMPFAFESDPGITLIEVDLEFAGEGVRTVLLRRADGVAARAVPFVASPGQPEYRWRSRAHRGDGETISTEWRTTTNRALVIAVEAPPRA